MNSSAYRQSSEGKRAQLEQHRALVRERVEATSALARALRTEAERERLGALLRRIEEHPTESLEQLNALESLLAELETLADELARVGRTRMSIPQLPMFGVKESASALLHEEPWMAQLGGMLEEVSSSRSVRVGDVSYGNRHEAGGVPMNLRASGQAGGNAHVSVVVAVPTGLPQVRLLPEQWVHRLGRLLGRSREATVDHEAFDDAFHVEWPDELARVVFDAALCETFATTRCTLEVAADCVGHATLSMVIRPTELVPSLQALVQLAQALSLRLHDLTGTPAPRPRTRTQRKAKPQSGLVNTSSPVRNFTIRLEDRVRSYGEPPAYSRRLRGIEDTVERTLDDLLAALDVSMAAAQRVLARVDLAKLNRAIAEHNRNFPMEANLPIDVETGRPRIAEGLFEPMQPWTEETFLQAAEDLRAAERGEPA